jgi:hypothetical protein
MIQLSEDESAVLNGVVAELGIHEPFPRLLERWASFVREVEGGYNESIYEYTNDLSVRDVIAKAMARSPHTIIEKISDYLGSLDKRFSIATFEIDRPLSFGSDTDLGRWWYRVPTKRGSELTDDLRSEGFIN